MIANMNANRNRRDKVYIRMSCVWNAGWNYPTESRRLRSVHLVTDVADFYGDSGHLGSVDIHRRWVVGELSCSPTRKCIAHAFLVSLVAWCHVHKTCRSVHDIQDLDCSGTLISTNPPLVICSNPLVRKLIDTHLITRRVYQKSIFYPCIQEP